MACFSDSTSAQQLPNSAPDAQSLRSLKLETVAACWLCGGFFFGQCFNKDHAE
jgi:hypothetical protein